MPVGAVGAVALLSGPRARQGPAADRTNPRPCGNGLVPPLCLGAHLLHHLVDVLGGLVHAQRA